ncbi:acyl-CoA synthetase [Mycolicibacillus parakoreensis]|uniref:Acyl-CoA synthetase n=1 Tax=Mycolicibacillus parakoreensis TaxID=1069221 RepID=A0ABY3U1D4_9MYCO|nr:acyl-CoA synthetase [Mycolicibacillus parakoreensis]MCV7314770.1 acyl-CoA synthetase [Mycolicibacillus parakoreensis]ULN53774.1 acyl-CoA synthetase [Mycolicibacillus parakoreensis]
MTRFDLSSVFATVADAIHEHTLLVWRGRNYSYGEINTRVDGVARYLTLRGLGCHTVREQLAGHQSGQDHVGIYLRNGNQYLETMLAGFRSRVAPFNVSYRYVEDELLYLLDNADARALVYGAEFAPTVASIRDRLSNLEVLIQVADDSGNALLPGAVDYESITTTTAPAAEIPTPNPDDLSILYTGGTTGMPKGVLWRQHDIFMASMGGRPFGSETPLASYAELAIQASQAPGALSILMLPPLMHGAAQWAAFNIITRGGRIVIPDDVHRLRPAEVLRLAEREKVLNIPVVGDAIARPLIEEIETGSYDLSSLLTISNGGAPLSPTLRERIVTALPHIMILDAVGASESGLQMNTMADKDTEAAVFKPASDTSVIASEFTHVLQPGEGEGWLARRDHIPLGYLGDEDKTAATFPTIGGVRWSVPGDRAEYLADGQIRLLGRNSLTINSGGEKIFVEEVERAVAAHPAVYDTVVVGRPSQRWGSEVVAIVQLAVDAAAVTDEEILSTCRRHIAGYKVPKAVIRAPKIMRSPVGKADYRWASDLATR